jgi:hypothetical protein
VVAEHKNDDHNLAISGVPLLYWPGIQVCFDTLHLIVFMDLKKYFSPNHWCKVIELLGIVMLKSADCNTLDKQVGIHFWFLALLHVYH